MKFFDSIHKIEAIFVLTIGVTMQYRIRQINKAYYPQYKNFLFWEYFWGYSGSFKYRHVALSLSEANQFISNRIKLLEKQMAMPIIKIHKYEPKEQL